MIALLGALAVTTAIAAPTVTDGDDAPLDDLAMMPALAEAALADEGGVASEAAAFFDMQGRGDGADHRAARRAAEWERRRHRHLRRHGGRHGGVDADGAVLGPAKDALRRGHGRFGLPRGGFVDMPGPGGTGGRIAAQSLAENGSAPGNADAPSSGAQPSGATQTVAVVLPGSGADAPVGTDRGGMGNGANGAEATATDAPFGERAPGQGGLKIQDTPGTLRLSFSQAAAPAEAVGAAGDAVPTPLPPSLLLFASGMGLFGLSRRKAG